MSCALTAPIASQSDRKDYKFIRLENGLKVLLIQQSDKSDYDEEPRFKKYKSNIAAVAMCVGVGSFDDPKEIQGKFHLIEHMIFMGSEKYQKENDFDQFLSMHSGYDNAYTESEYTLFYFDIIEKHLSGALDRFAHLFIAPLMSLSSMQREIAAVESEFQNNINDDDVRITHIYASMIYDHHPSSNFIWGNLKTLRDDIDSGTLHEKIHESRRRDYTADRMCLCVQSSVDINRIERSVVTYFSAISRGEGSTAAAVTATGDPFEIFKPDFHEKLFFVKSTSEKCKLLITFALPPAASSPSQHKFLEYLASLIQHEGAGSLSDFFMDEALALKVKARVGSQNFEGNSFFTLFTIDVNLTTRGFRDFDCVLAAIFSFLLLLKSTKSEEHESRYREFREIKETLFKYRKEKTAIENVQEIAVNMRHFGERDVLVGNNFCPDFDATTMRTLIDRLNERKFNVLVLSDKYCKPHNMRERWFNTEYSAVDFPLEYKRLWNERWLKPELFLPKANEFVCRNFGVFNNPSEKEEREPRKIVDSALCDCFYKMDKKYELPYGYVYVYFISPLTQASVENLNMTSIYSMCVKNFLSEKLFAATLVGYSYKLNSVDAGLVLRIGGFNEKLPLIVDIITREMTASRYTKTVFETFKKELKKNCYNCLMDLNILNDDYRHSVLKPNHRSFSERYRQVDSIKYQDFKAFAKRLLERLKIRILIQGNFVKSRAAYIKEIILNNLRPEAVDAGEVNDAQIHQIPLGSTSIKARSLRANDFNAVIKNYYQVGGCGGVNPIADITVSMLTEPLFDILRTHQQLGYGISCSLRRNNGVTGITITVEYQENHHSADFIDARIEEFLVEYQQTLVTMSDEDFAAAKRCFISSKLTSDNDLEVEVNRNFDEIRSDECVFNRNALEAAETEKITREEILEFYRRTFIAEATKRKLSIQVLGCTQQEPGQSHQSAIESSIETFQECCKICS